MKKPCVEIGDCVLCGMCEEICSQVFFISDLGFVQVADLSAYPEAEVNEVIKYCPADCVEWA